MCEFKQVRMATIGNKYDDDTDTEREDEINEDRNPKEEREPLHRTGVQPSVLPIKESWMGPYGVPYNPPALKLLAKTDHICVKHLIAHSRYRFFSTPERRNKYIIKNMYGQHLFYVIDDGPYVRRAWYKTVGPMSLKILDNFHNGVINMYRPHTWSGGMLEVSSPPGIFIGSIEKHWSIAKPIYMVKNAFAEDVLSVKGHTYLFNCFGSEDFIIRNNTGQIGTITKEWSGVVSELFTETENYNLTFPLDLDVHIKALLLGATFLIDMNYYHNNQ